MLQFVVIAVIAAAVTAVISSVVLWVSRRFRIGMSAPRERDVHVTPTPRLGGVAMYCGIVAAIAVAAGGAGVVDPLIDSHRAWVLLGACSIVAFAGLLDDLFDLDWMVKLSAQLLATGLLAWQGAQIVSLPIGDTLVVGSPVLNLILTVILMTLVMNAVNFIDGLDGLVAGVAIIATSVFFVYTQLLIAQAGADSSINFAAVVAATVVGIACGFLPFNWHRARMFMGDTGALLIGLLMATSTVTVTGQLNPAALEPELVLAGFIPIILPIAILALPLADFTLAVLRRLAAGKSPFSADRRHLHHRLLDMGHSPVQVVLIFYLWTAVVSFACLLVFTQQNYLWATVVAAAGSLLCFLVTITPYARVRTWLTERARVRATQPASQAATTAGVHKDAKTAENPGTPDNPETPEYPETGGCDERIPQ